MKLEIELSEVGGPKSLESWVAYSAAVCDVSEKRFVEAILEAVRSAGESLNNPADFGVLYEAALKQALSARR